MHMYIYYKYKFICIYKRIKVNTHKDKENNHLHNLPTQKQALHRILLSYKFLPIYGKAFCK